MSDEQPTLICSPVEDHKTYPGAIHGWCQICAHTIWISPQGQAHLVTHPKSKVVCVECGMPQAARSPERLRIVKGAREAVEKAEGPGAMARAERALQRELRRYRNDG